jgi:hypothetical protein
MGVKSSVSTFTIQPPAPNLSEVHFYILNLKNRKWSNFLYFPKFPMYFPFALCLMKINTKSNETLGTCYLYI